MEKPIVLVLVPGSKIRIFQSGKETGEAVVSYVDEVKQEVGIKNLLFSFNGKNFLEKGTVRLVLREDGWRELVEYNGKSYPETGVPPISFEAM